MENCAISSIPINLDIISDKLVFFLYKDLTEQRRFILFIQSILPRHSNNASRQHLSLSRNAFLCMLNYYETLLLFFIRFFVTVQKKIKRCIEHEIILKIIDI